MTIRNLDAIFRPRSIAIVGASRKPNSIGRTVVENLLAARFGGDIYPVNPNYETILELPAYGSLSQLPQVPDLVVLCTPAATIAGLIDECGELGIQGLIALSAGFREVGPSGEVLEQEIQSRLAKYRGMRMIGPNCLGVIVPRLGMNASFAAATPKDGGIAFISQSGALCTSVLDWSLMENVGFSNFVSIGNATNVKVGDLIDYFAEDPHTHSIVLYLESVTEARGFMSAARAFTRTKPIVVYKAGKFAESAQAAASHTGALAGVDAAYEAAFKRAGMVRIQDAKDMFDCAELLARHRLPNGPSLGIITNAGGPGVMAVDELLARHGNLAKLDKHTLEQLHTVLPAHWSKNNPVDILGDAVPARYAEALQIVLADPGVDAVLTILTPQAMTDPTGSAQAVAEVAAKSAKPVLAAWMGGPAVTPGHELLTSSGIATYDSPDRAVRAFMYLLSYVRNREVLYETPRDVPLSPAVRREVAHQKLSPLRQDPEVPTTDVNVVSEIRAKELLSAYGIPTTAPRLATTSEEAVALANDIGYPVVMKIHSPQITHKSDVGGVVTRVADATAVIETFERITSSARRLAPHAVIEGVTVQEMIAAADAVELIVGAKQDPVFGAVLMVGAGGVTAELMQDVAMELPPLNEHLARRMLESLRSWPLLQGYRGRPAMKIEQLVETLMHVSYLVAHHPEILELDINPLLATPTGAIAVDARMVLDPQAAEKSPRQFSHLAIQPYPEEFVRPVRTSDGMEILLRPIRPEDEPQWHALMQNCSQRSLWLRFRYLFKESTHEMATRFCFVDYDRTMAIVAEATTEDGGRQLLGVGRLVADADHTNAEYAVLVADAWQGKGIGALLTDECLRVCETWGIDRVFAETTSDNHRMQQILTGRGFSRDKSADGGELLFRKRLGSPASTNGELAHQTQGSSSPV